MTEAKQQHQWQQTASLMALIANVNRDPKKTRAFTVSDFDPFAAKNVKGTVIDKDNIELLRNFFTGDKNHENRCTE